MFTKCHMLEVYSKQTWKKKNLNKRIVMSKVLRAFPCEIQVHLWDYTSICISIVQGNTITKVNILASSTQIRIRYRQ